jgi:Tfp pilus assembly protein PilO
MAVTGSYHRIGRFLSNVGSLTRIIAPMNLSLLPTARDQRTLRIRPGEAVLDASFEIQTYVAKTSAPATPAAAAPARGQ